jgi:hypothetical protein
MGQASGEGREASRVYLRLERLRLVVDYYYFSFVRGRGERMESNGLEWVGWGSAVLNRLR